MDDLNFGKRNKRGDWAPDRPAETAPLFAFPPQLTAVLKWLPHYFLPWNLIFAASALAYWAWIIPPVATMQTLSLGWIARLYAVNAICVFLFYGAFELHLYVLKRQENRFKYNGKFPGEQRNNVFWFKSQNLDNILRTFLSGVTIWTAAEVGMLWAYANGYAPWLGFAENPWTLALVALVLPVIHEFHFFCIHRLIHTPFLYKWVHSVHHNSVNPSPWSSLSMHPVEHLLYFGTAFYHLILPSNPVIMLYQLHYAGFGAIPGHVGFDKIEVGREGLVDSHAYAHYLHHKYFEVNYGDALIPLDKWFGTWHDGSPEGEAQMQERYRRRKEKLAARKASLEAGGAAE
ncbi:sterol desaturase family protein [Rhizobium bangladeshense]|uniref:sterol desaturase family protein n=1 Tax=Rhizobium bangladeshense TaxID=1138189 RepID=UPI001C8342AE|nr:sterol desaturase family protein [Rhizobium bangladeshense]MBX4919426.1 sterol desaturase family protein [Rhizobium bangladeshense]